MNPQGIELYSILFHLLWVAIESFQQKSYRISFTLLKRAPWSLFGKWIWGEGRGKEEVGRPVRRCCHSQGDKRWWPGPRLYQRRYKNKKKMIMCLGIIFFNEHLLRGKIKSSVFAMLDLEPVGYLSKNVK